MSEEGVVDVLIDVKDSFRITRWKVKAGTKISKGCLLALYETQSDKKTLKLKADKNHVGTVMEVVVKEKDSVDAGSVVLKIEKCKHPTIMKDMCAECGADLKKIRIQTDFKNSQQESFKPTPPVQKTASVAMVHSIPELRVSKEEAESLGRADQKRLLGSRKLVLMVDLDQTLIHTTNENIDPKIDDVLHFQLWPGHHAPWYHTRIRPHTTSFLANINKLYELHIVTFGSRMYAHTVAKFIDPQGKLFSHRILSRDECFDSSSKTANLKDLFPCGDSMVAIIDDREDVWNFVPNLIPVRAYNFFQGTGDINAPPGSSRSSIPPAIKKAQTENEARDAGTTKLLASAAEAIGSDVDLVEGGDEAKYIEKGEYGEEKEVGVEKIEGIDAYTEESIKDELVNEKTTSDGDNSLSTETSKESSETKELRTSTKESASSDIDSGQFTQSTQSSDESKEIEEKMKEVAPVIECDGLWAESEDKQEADEGEGSKKNGGEGGGKEGGTSKVESDVKSQARTEGTSASSEFESNGKIVIEDHDDYLIYLEDVLKRIHAAFYELYDQKNSQETKQPEQEGEPSEETKESGEHERKVPDLKHVMPYVRKKILKGVNVLFSGVIPRNVIPERHKIFRAALALGAKVHKHLVTSGEDKTTHVVAARLGTEKVLHAQRKGIHVVIPHWLWSCAERWERVDERVFELTKETEIQLDDVRARSGRSSPTVLGPHSGRESKNPKRKVNATEAEDKQKGVSVDIYDSKTGTKLIYRPGKRAKLDDDSVSTDVNQMQFDEVFDGEDEEAAAGASTSGEVGAAGKKSSIGDGDEGDPDLQFAESFNPLLRFSRGDLDNMDKEVDDMVSSDDDDEDDSEKEDEKLRELVLHGSPGGSSGGGSSPRGHSSRDSDTDDSLSGDYPRGWGIPKRRQSSPRDPTDVDDENAEGTEENPRDNEIMKEEDVLSDDDNDDYQESIGSEDEDMAAALEQEFLGKQFIAFSSKDEIGKSD